MKADKKENNAVTQTVAKKTKPFFRPRAVQTKLEIGQPNDKHEVEADRIADEVVSMSSTQKTTNRDIGTFVQRKCTDCNEEDHIQKKSLAETITPLIQKKGTASVEGGVASDSINSKINGSAGSGNRLSKDAQTFMENRFGTNFSNVRIHTDSNAQQLSSELNAQAFTVGNDIYFNEGKYNPNSGEGKHLLAHELTHTIQQSGIQPNLKIQREMVKDRDGALVFSSAKEARNRLDNMIRIVPNTNHKDQFLLEWRWNPTNPSKDPWQTGTKSRTKKATEQRLNELMRVEGKGNKWYVLKDTKLKPEDIKKAEVKDTKKTASPQVDKENKSEDNTKTTSPSGDVYLTFDDGPNYGTEGVLDVLKDEGVKGTFFVNFKNFSIKNKDKKALITRMRKEKHSIGNHTYSHMKGGYGLYKDFNKKKDKFYKDEIVKNQEEFESLMGKDYIKKGLLRLPYGGPSNKSFKKKIISFLKSKGVPHIGWNTEFKNKKTKHVNYMPWEGIKAACSRKNLKSLPKNPNILFHDADWKGIKGILRNIIKKLKERYSSFKKL